MTKSVSKLHWGQALIRMSLLLLVGSALVHFSMEVITDPWRGVVNAPFPWFAAAMGLVAFGLLLFGVRQGLNRLGDERKTSVAWLACSLLLPALLTTWAWWMYRTAGDMDAALSLSESHSENLEGSVPGLRAGNDRRRAVFASLAFSAVVASVAILYGWFGRRAAARKRRGKTHSAP